MNERCEKTLLALLRTGRYRVVVLWGDGHEGVEEALGLERERMEGEGANTFVVRRVRVEGLKAVWVGEGKGEVQEGIAGRRQLFIFSSREELVEWSWLLPGSVGVVLEEMAAVLGDLGRL